jgi:O-antigen/teichoic acid export membrane protein
MMGRAAHAAGGFAAKGLGLAAQLLTLVLITQALGAQEFGRYSLLLSIASIAAQLADFGLGRYQFRRAHRGSPVATLVMWSIAFRLTATVLLLPLLLFYAARSGLPVPAILLAFAANILFQLANLNRCLLLLRHRVAGAILVESAPALIFCAGVALCVAVRLPIGVDAALLLYLIATLMGFALSVAGAGTAKSWLRGVVMLLRGSGRRTLAGVAVLARRSSLVGIDIFLAAATFNAPILIVSALGGDTATPQVALYQRILGLEVALLSVTVTARLKRYYDDGGRGVLDLSPALAAGAIVFALNLLGLGLLGPVAALLPDVHGFTLAGLVLSLRPHSLLIASVTACVAGYLHCSMAALGGDRLWQRCLSAGAGLATTVGMAALLYQAEVEPVRAVLLASLLGQIVAIAALLAGVARDGVRIRLPRLPSGPGGQPAAGTP